MSGRLAGKKALVTAAGQGIGQAIALAYAAEGAEVLATDINAETLKQIEGKNGIRIQVLDVMDADAISALAAEIGAVDILTNVAGYVANGSILDCTDKDWDFSFNLNVKSMYHMCQAMLPAMLENGGGSIVNIASVASSVMGIPNRFAYGASKAAVIGLTKSIAADFVTRGVTCNGICPGTVQSPSLDERIAALGDPVEARKAFVARQPMGRLGTTDEIAAAAVYLASDDATFTTGTLMMVDGGMTI
ncbi:MAG: SDR family oxidoreductase [Rhodospirillales bacterium]|nr:SDR family oxidoreductase [Rhodospirillales bacterium]